MRRVLRSKESESLIEGALALLAVISLEQHLCDTNGGRLSVALVKAPRCTNSRGARQQDVVDAYKGLSVDLFVWTPC